MSKTTEWLDTTDPDVRDVWTNALIDVTFNRRTLAAEGRTPDPEWDEWEAEAKRVLGLSAGAYVNDRYEIVEGS